MRACAGYPPQGDISSFPEYFTSGKRVDLVEDGVEQVRGPRSDVGAGPGGIYRPLVQMGVLHLCGLGQPYLLKLYP